MSLFIVSGELRGVSIPLDDDEMRIGHCETCDVVLVSDNDDESEILLTKAQSGLSAEAISGHVQVGRRTLRPGKSVSVGAQVPIAVGDVTMIAAISTIDAERAVTRHQKRNAAAAWAASLAVAIGAIGVAGLSSGESFGARSTGSQVNKVPVKTAAAFTPTLAAEALRSKLDGLGLTRLSAQSDRVDRVIRVSGPIRPSDKTTWLAAQEWFDTEYGDVVQLDARLTLASDKVTLPFLVEAVWMGPTPRLTLQGGARHQEGDILPGGWRLDDIAVNAVKLTKNGETLTVPL